MIQKFNFYENFQDFSQILYFIFTYDTPCIMYRMRQAAPSHGSTIFSAKQFSEIII